MSDTTNAPAPNVVTAHIMTAPLGSLTPQQAGEWRAQLMADKDFADRAASGITVEGERLRDLRIIERGGVPPSLRPTETGPDVLSQMDDRAVRAAEQHRDALILRQGLSGRQAHEIQFGRPVLQAWHDENEYLYESLKNDQDFLAARARGDRKAVGLMREVQIKRRQPVGTAEQIAQWDRDFPYQE